MPPRPKLKHRLLHTATN